MVGAGPGAHGYIGDVRWWNVKHPRAYADALNGGAAPIAGFERLDRRARHIEDVLLGIRLRRGLSDTTLSGTEMRRALRAVEDRLLGYADGRLVLTGRAGCSPTRWCGIFSTTENRGRTKATGRKIER